MTEELNECCCSALQVGQQAPEFTLPGVETGKEFKQYSLKDYRGKWVVFFFYPLDFTFICPTEVTAMSDRYAEFQKINTVVLGCSTDSVNSHQAWMKDLVNLKYPLLSDKTHEVSREYGVLVEEEGIALRGLFIINPDGILHYHLVHDLNVGRNVDEVLRVLQALQTGELCQVGWKPGEKTLGKA
ncbi:MAG: thioredoxin peroxidase [Candidatus Kerfeldbacteria bacterium CG_4_10_14_0_8_um_filter_42_10]|uniref:Thioredoxin peroxidase n=1 Tax=Candidatus Kerfeldbacteria bacterium CG_4_10_14_0_8_um_filter_42_10 TaxID=2014248 RepID=A0A2M7RGQ4_9BACT|nr:MAG: thioredoxin peroxidase [Candidatus Kerfeldbacteria bacterium CG_4_10_14_0_8_um_filter_42_10]